MAQNRSTKAFFLGVKHGIKKEHTAYVDGRWEEISDIIMQRGAPHGKVFIELPPEFIERARHDPSFTWKGYARIVRFAAQHGMQVIGLDRQRTRRVVEKMMDEPLAMGEAHDRIIGEDKSVSKFDFISDNREYAMRELREKDWKLQLRTAKKGDLVIAHPNHIAALTNRQTDAPNIRYIHEPEPFILKKIHDPKRKARMREIHKKRRQQLNSQRKRK